MKNFITRKKKILIPICLSLIIIFLYILTYLFFLNKDYKEENFVSFYSMGDEYLEILNDNKTLFRIDVGDVTDFVWSSDQKLYLKSDYKILIVDIVDRNPEVISDQFVSWYKLGYENGELLICEWENKVITSPDQFATEFKVISLPEKKIHHKSSLHETVMPISCSMQELYFTNNYHGAPEQFYKYNTSNGLINEISIDQYFSIIYQIEGEERTMIKKDGEILFEIDKINSFIEAKPNPSETGVALLDYEGYIWVYQNH